MSDAEWLAWRREGVSASDVAGIVGVSPWDSPWSVWANKVGLAPEKEASEAMEFGKRAEPLLAEWFHDRTGLHVIGEQTWCTHPTETWMRATVDGFVAESPDAALDEVVACYEAKTTSEAPWDEVPVHYQCQAQWQMAVTGMPRVWFGVLHLAFGRPTFREYRFERNQREVDFLVEQCRRFWVDHVLTGCPPEVDASEATTTALSHAYTPDPDATVDVAGLAYTLDELARIEDDMKRLEAMRDHYRNTLRAALGDATTGVIDGEPVVTWKAQTARRLDTARLRADLPEVAAQYETESVTRVLRVKAKGES